jgi:RNA polymerase sigma-70 factor, ECF subfamily
MRWTVSSVALGMPSGTPDVLAKLYGEFYPRVLRLCQYFLGSREDAEDAASEVFVRLPRALTTYDRAQPIWSWLSAVTHHHCVDRLRSRRSEQRAFEPADAEASVPVSQTASPLDKLLSSEAREAVRAALARLPERYQAPLILRYYRDLSYDEIAERLGLSRGNIAILVFRAKQRLRLEFTEKV